MLHKIQTNQYLLRQEDLIKDLTSFQLPILVQMVPLFSDTYLLHRAFTG